MLYIRMSHSGCAFAECVKIYVVLLFVLWFTKIRTFQNAEHTYFYSIALWQWSNLLFWTFSIICFLMKCGVSRAASASVFRQGKRLIWWVPYIQLFWVAGQHRSVSLLRYVPENRSCPTVVPDKWLSKIKKLTGRLKKQKMDKVQQKGRLCQSDTSSVIYGWSNSHINKNFL